MATSADLSVAKTGPSTVTAGTNLTYTVTVSNSGPSDAQLVSLTDAIPAGTTFHLRMQLSGPAFSFTNPAVGGTGTITGSLGALSAGGSALFQIVVHLTGAATIGTVIDNAASVSSVTSSPRRRQQHVEHRPRHDGRPTDHLALANSTNFFVDSLGPLREHVRRRRKVAPGHPQPFREHGVLHPAVRQIVRVERPGPGRTFLLSLGTNAWENPELVVNAATLTPNNPAEAATADQVRVSTAPPPTTST